MKKFRKVRIKSKGQEDFVSFVCTKGTGVVGEAESGAVNAAG
jgi:hypothetical protein